MFLPKKGGTYHKKIDPAIKPEEGGLIIEIIA